LGWADLRRSLPEAFQEKIAQAELEQHRRARSLKRRQFHFVDTSPEAYAQLELEIAQKFEGDFPLKVEASAVWGSPLSSAAEVRDKTVVLLAESVAMSLQASSRPDVGVQSCPSQAVEIGREPYAWEQQEFEQWYELAEAFGLVDDFYWDGCQYWVSRDERVWVLAEMLGVFTVGWLRKQLGCRT
jgi:hypothetical protein